MNTKEKQPEVLNVLCLEDSPMDAEIMRELLLDAGYNLNMDCISVEKEFVTLLRSRKYDIILSDFKLPGFDGFASLRWSLEICPDVPFICVSGTVGEEIAVELLIHGAVDYILKDRLEKLPFVIKRALKDVKEKEARQHSEKKLNASEIRYRRLFESAKDGILILNAESGKIVDVNPFLVELLGYSADQLRGMKIWEIGIFTDIIASKENFIELQQNEYIRYDDMPLKTIDGRQIAVEFVSNVYLVNHEKVIQCNIRDISERKNSMEALKNSEERFSKIFLESAIPLAFSNHKFQFTQVNRPFVNLLGYSEHELEQMTFYEITHPEYIQNDVENINKLLSGELTVYRTEKIYIHKNKKPIWGLVNVSVLKDNKGVFLSFIIMLLDITERKKAEIALAKEQYLMNALMDNIPDNIYFKDRESQFIRISKAQAKLFGLNDPLEAEGKTDFDFFSEEHARKAYEDEQKIISTGQLLSKEEKETWPDRPDTWVSTTKLPLNDKGGNIIGTFGISMDITVRKEIELLLIQKNQEIESQNEEYKQINEELYKAKEHAEESDSLKTAFLQNMSHEIRTPMNGILGFSELLKNPELTGEKQKEFIGIIEQSGQRMLNIINDIVNISKIETGQIELEVKETNVNSLLQHLHSFFTPEAKNKGLNLTFTTELSDELSVIETDDTKLTQVLSNLIKNALKFTKSGSIDFGYHFKRQMLEFYVLDTGIGIAPEMQEVIFERFRQVEMSGTRNYEGAGLGLAISKAFVEKLGGKMRVESELGKGSAFFINIPYKQTALGETGTKMQNVLDGKFPHVGLLIAEDDDTCMQLLKEMLENENANLFFANNGQEAIEIVKTTPEVQIVLMDLKMPIIDGFEATKLIKSLNPGLPVIAQSAYAFSEDEDKARKAGCDEFISKPVKRELLLSMIKKQLARFA